jgi:hypothetical protein
MTKTVAGYFPTLEAHGVAVHMSAPNENLGEIKAGGQTFKKAGQYDPTTKTISGYADAGLMAHEMGHAELDYGMQQRQRGMQDYSMVTRTAKADVYKDGENETRENYLRADDRFQKPENNRQELHNKLMDFQWSLRDEAGHPTDYSKAWKKEYIADGPTAVAHPLDYMPDTRYGGVKELRLGGGVWRHENEAYAEFSRGYVLADLKKREVIDDVNPQYDFKKMGTKESRDAFLALRKVIQKQVK